MTCIRTAFKLLILLSITQSKIRLIEPAEYISEIKDEVGSPGELDYSVSMFGDIDYLREDEVEVILPPETNPYGCKEIGHTNSSSTARFAYLFKRGICPFTKKSHIAKLVS